MITTQIESFEDTMEELKVLLPLHWKELALNRDKIPLDPQYDVYIARERRGELLFATIREDGDLIGYFIAFINPGLHYKTCLTCITDIFYLVEEHRGNKSGIRLFEFVEKELRRRGVMSWYAGEKLHKPCGWMLRYLNFEPVETMYLKWLGE